jgi:hypothetical protein
MVDASAGLGEQGGTQESLDQRIAKLERQLDDVHRAALETKLGLNALEAHMARYMTEAVIWIIAAMGLLSMFSVIFS